MKALVVANWKMNPETVQEAKKIFTATKKAADSATSVKIIVTPPALYLSELKRGYRGKRVVFGSQHAHHKDSGSLTGDISMAQMKSAGATHVLIGHAERRKAGETNEDTREKIKAAVRLGLTPILCVGEHERDPRGAYLHFVRSQLLEGLASMPKKKIKQLIIAYEPVWAIGAEKPMGAHEMHEMSLFIRKVLVEAYDETAVRVPVLYGGSVKEPKDLIVLKEGHVQGLLVGRASVDTQKITTLIKAIAAL